MVHQPYRLGLIGHPVKQSISPVLHNTAMAELGLLGRYEAVDVLPGRLADWIGAMALTGYAGVNVTIPHKEAALPLMTEVSAGAAAIGAVNTIIVTENGLRGENTDHTGFLAPLRPVLLRRPVRSALILGAGGAARSVLYALSGIADFEQIRICTRSEKRGEALIDSTAFRGVNVSTTAWDRRHAAASSVDLIVNTTPVGMWPNPSLSPLFGASFSSEQIVYDLIYNPRTTRLLQDAGEAGAVCLRGLPMLIGQAAAAFQLWTGQAMPLAKVTQAAEKALSPDTPS
ncbi:MAG: shikimate dehydrogenase [Rhodothermales bacterium]|jgi:shikimate dehydrogenase